MRKLGLALFPFFSLAGEPTGAAASDDLRAYGEYIASECVTCHQISGEYKGIPPIVGWDPAIFIDVMNAYRAKQRENKVMQTIAGALSDEEIKALAAYFSSVKP